MLTQVSALHGHSERVWHVSWRKDGKMIASCSGDKSIRLWKQVDGVYVCVIILEDMHNRTIRACEWSLDGRYIASVGFDAIVVVWEEKDSNFEVIATLEGHENEVKSVAWSPSGSYIATCSRDKSVWIWDTDPETEFECVSVLHAHTQDVKFVKWHPKMDILFSASYDDTIRVWEENEDDWYCKEVLQGHTSTVWGLALSADGERLASCSDDNTVIIWKYDAASKDMRSDGTSMCWKRESTLSGYHTRTIYSIDWEHTQNYLVTASGDDSIRIFKMQQTPNATEWIPVEQKSKAHLSDVNCVRWGPHVNSDTMLLASAGDDGFVRIWSLSIMLPNATINS